MDKDIILELDKMGISIESEFIPFSKSQYKDKKIPNLNWIVTLKKHNNVILKADYFAGIGLVPAVGLNHPKHKEGRLASCESGYEMNLDVDPIRPNTTKPILPKLDDFVYCVICDTDALDCVDFSEWCSNFGYNNDSITHHKVYTKCLENTLALRAGLGESQMNRLKNIFEGF